VVAVATDGNLVGAVTVGVVGRVGPVADENVVARVAVEEAVVRDTGLGVVLHVEGRVGTGHHQGVLVVAVPVADQDVVAGVPVPELAVGLAGGLDVVLDEEVVAALLGADDGEAVAVLAVPVADEDPVTGVAVGEDVDGLPVLVGDVEDTVAVDHRRVDAVTVPVTVEDLVARVAEDQGLDGLATGAAGAAQVVDVAGSANCVALCCGRADGGGKDAGRQTRGQEADRKSALAHENGTPIDRAPCWATDRKLAAAERL
jgi:hypothetical protein